MKSLTTYIMEAESNSFTQEVRGMSELKNEAGDKLYVFGKKYWGKKTDEDDGILNRIVTVFNEVIGQNTIKYSTGSKYFFKVPYTLCDDIRSAFEKAKIPGVRIEGGGEKINLYYKKMKLMETGRGSGEDDIKTKDQEDATCLVFNAYMDVVEKDKDFNQIGDLEYIKKVLSAKFPVHSFDNIWMKCFSNQVMSIVDYLYRITGNKNIASYRLVRFNEGGQVSTMYTNMVKSYAGIKGARKDVFDATDVILFDKNKIGVIEKYCKEPTDEESANKIRTDFLDNCFGPRICMGISLKKLSKSGKIKEYNTGRESIPFVKEYKIIKSTTKNVTIKCSWSFNLDETTDVDKNNIDNVKNIALTLRTFSKGVVAMDATVTNDAGSYDGPSLGKCPVDIWRPMLRVEKKEYKDIEACTSKFIKFIEDKDTPILDSLKALINGALKEGPSCFPFILIH